MKRRRRKAAHRAGLVFLFDLDDTLIDNDRIQRDVRRHLEKEYGNALGSAYWKVFDKVKSESGYSDFIGALERYRELGDKHPALLLMSSYLVDYPFRQRVFRGAARAIAHAHRLGEAVIVTDGDVVFQPRKILRSGLWKRVRGNVLIYEHKADRVEDILRCYPADHYVLVEDRMDILKAMKRKLGSRLTTVFVRQGELAHSRSNLAIRPPADITLDSIDELADCPRELLVAAACSG